MSILRLMRSNYLLVLICLLFLFTRFYKIAEIPASVYWDEASIGINAYAISESGNDEWGETFPFHFRAFGEFKLPVYIYAAAISAKAFGLNEFSVRFPAVLFSLGVVLLTYLLTKRLLQSEVAGLIAAFFISISPWFFIFSRAGYEATAGLLFYILGIYLFILTKEKVTLFIPAILSFILSMYSYNSFRVITPLTLIILAFLYYDTLVYHSKGKILVIISATLVLLSLIPIIRLVKSDGGAARLQTVGIFSSGNKREVLFNFTRNYLSHFSPDFLFLNGDKNQRSQQSGFGQLYFPELILLPLGLLHILRNKSKYRLLPLILLLLGPIPAAITKESPHALRAISMVSFLALISAEGAVSLSQFAKKKLLINSFLVVIFLAFFINYFINFLNFYPIKSSKDWQYGYRKIYTDYRNQFDRYERIIISDEYGQPYIFALFYQKFDPDNFRQTVTQNSVDQWGFSTVSGFDKFKFGKIDKLLKSESEHSLIFASEKEKIDSLTPIGIIRFLDGTVAFWVYEQ